VSNDGQPTACDGGTANDNLVGPGLRMEIATSEVSKNEVESAILQQPGHSAIIIGTLLHGLLVYAVVLVWISLISAFPAFRLSQRQI
jgi:hypothetical protein